MFDLLVSTRRVETAEQMYNYKSGLHRMAYEIRQKILQWPSICFIKASSHCSDHESRSLGTGRTVDTVKAAWITSAGMQEKMEFDAYGRL